MEKKIQELKQRIQNDIEIFVSKFVQDEIEQFTALLTEMSNNYLIKTKEREIELKNEVERLSKEKNDIETYINGTQESVKDFSNKMSELNKENEKIKIQQENIDKQRHDLEVAWKDYNQSKDILKKEKDAFEKEKAQFKIKQAMVEEQVKTLRKLNI